MLCKTCKSSMETSAPRNSHPTRKTNTIQFVGHHSTLEELRKSASSPCYICKTLVILLDENGVYREALGEPSFYTECAYLPDDKIVQFLLSGIDNHDRKLLDKVQFSVSPVLDRSKSVEYAATSQKTDDETCLLLARRWLKACATEHPTCNRLRNNHWYPTRVMNIGEQSSESIKLVETAKQPISGHYMTLSHCWGGQPTISLTRDTLEQFKQSILIQNLPRTFIEAISLAREFNIRYLWIDCLCIIQDMISDWETEAAQMDQVYQHSHCNIGAADSYNSEGGLFRPRNPALVNAPQWSFNGIKYSIAWNDLFRKSMELSPLYKRGWVLQERWLCPRMLHFGTDQMFWECRTATASETLPGFSIGPNFGHLKYEDLTPTDKTPQVSKQIGVVTGHKSDSWSYLLSVYSGTSLTYDTDKMVAFSGLVKAMEAQNQKDEYLAGLWKINFVLQLAWSLDQRQSALSRYDQYIAPSWSWASIRGPIKFPTFLISDENEYLTVMIDHHIEYINSDRSGGILSGWVLLEGPLREMNTRNVSLKRYNKNVAFNEGLFEDTIEGSSRIGCRFALDSEYLQESDCIEAVFVLPLFWSPRGNHHPILEGLLLRLKPGENNTFVRIGRWICLTSAFEWAERISKPAIIASLPHVPFDPVKGHSVKIF